VEPLERAELFDAVVPQLVLRGKSASNPRAPNAITQGAKIKPAKIAPIKTKTLEAISVRATKSITYLLYRSYQHSFASIPNILHPASISLTQLGDGAEMPDINPGHVQAYRFPVGNAIDFERDAG